MSENIYLRKLRNGQKLDANEQTWMILQLSWPAILAQLSVVIMQLIDAGMVGRLSKYASAAIGLVSSSTWLINGLASGSVYGYSVQVSQKIGARDARRARSLCFQGLYVVLLFGIVLGTTGILIGRQLPIWLHGEEQVLEDASAYFRIFCLFLPFCLINSWAVSMLQSAGNTKVPGMAQIVMCFLDVVLNFIFIFPSTPWFFGFGLGTAGAALGTGLACALVSLFLLFYICRKETWFQGTGKIRLSKKDAWQAFRIGAPISAEQAISCSAYVAFTYIVSSLGSVAVAANSFAITVESICYMPGYGIGAAASGLIGQCTGAGRNELTKALSKRICILGIGIMTLSGSLMFAAAPGVMHLLTTDEQVAAMGAQILQIEAFAEPMYGASIVASGILRGLKDTLFPAVLSFISMWCIRIPLAWLLSFRYGLPGVWFAMMIELNARGILFLGRLYFRMKNLQ